MKTGDAHATLTLSFPPRVGFFSGPLCLRQSYSVVHVGLDLTVVLLTQPPKGITGTKHHAWLFLVLGRKQQASLHSQEAGPMAYGTTAMHQGSETWRTTATH